MMIFSVFVVAVGGFSSFRLPGSLPFLDDVLSLYQRRSLGASEAPVGPS